MLKKISFSFVLMLFLLMSDMMAMGVMAKSVTDVLGSLENSEISSTSSRAMSHQIESVNLGIFSKMADGISTSKSGIASFFSRILNGFSRILSKLFSGVGNFLSSVFGGTGSMADLSSSLDSDISIGGNGSSSLSDNSGDSVESGSDLSSDFPDTTDSSTPTSKGTKLLWSIVSKYCEANQRYKLGSGHKWTRGYTGVTDCSGFVGLVHLKMAEATGVSPAFRKNGWIPTSQQYASSKYSKKITSSWPPPNPRDLIKPGDLIIMGKGGGSYGHIGIFMGYDKSGNVLMAHSTSARIRSSRVKGKVGRTGVRVEVIPRRYKRRFRGIYRLHGTSKMMSA